MSSNQQVIPPRWLAGFLPSTVFPMVTSLSQLMTIQSVWKLKTLGDFPVSLPQGISTLCLNSRKIKNSLEKVTHGNFIGPKDVFCQWTLLFVMVNVGNDTRFMSPNGNFWSIIPLFTFTFPLAQWEEERSKAYLIST